MPHRCRRRAPRGHSRASQQGPGVDRSASSGWGSSGRIVAFGQFLNNRGTKTQGGDCQFAFASDAPPEASGLDIYELLKDRNVTVNPIAVVSQGIARVANSSFDGETLSLDRAATSAVYYAFCIDEYVHGRPRTLEAKAYFGGPGATPAAPSSKGAQGHDRG